MSENVRREDIILKAYVEKYTVEAFKKYAPYEPCVCKSGKKFKFCCYAAKEKSKAWEYTRDIINDLLTKKKLHDKIKRFEGA